jgi:hypothetical protein
VRRKVFPQQSTFVGCAIACKKIVTFSNENQIKKQENFFFEEEEKEKEKNLFFAKSFCRFSSQFL